MDRWQSRVIAALRCQMPCTRGGAKARGATGVPCPTRGSNPLRSACSLPAGWVTNWVTMGASNAGRPWTAVDRSHSPVLLLAQLIDG